MGIQQRDLAKAIILTIITCGIYGIYWMICINEDTKTVSGDTSFPTSGMLILLTIVTCGIYSLYWLYRIGQALKSAQVANGLEAKDNSVLYLVLELFGFGIVAYALIQNDLNAIARKNGAV